MTTHDAIVFVLTLIIITIISIRSTIRTNKLIIFKEYCFTYINEYIKLINIKFDEYFDSNNNDDKYKITIKDINDTDILINNCLSYIASLDEIYIILDFREITPENYLNDEMLYLIDYVNKNRKT